MERSLQDDVLIEQAEAMADYCEEKGTTENLSKRVEAIEHQLKIINKMLGIFGN